MDVRGKLVDLILDAKRTDPETGRFTEYLADYLVSNGVTVQESGHWVTLTDCSNEGVYCSVCHKKVYMNDYALCNRKTNCAPTIVRIVDQRWCHSRRKENDYGLQLQRVSVSYFTCQKV